MKTIQTEVFTFDELSDDAKETARQWWREGAFDFEWWDSTYEDAENIGLKITSFDCGRGTIDGELTCSVHMCCEMILKEHGKDCDTYKLAQTFFTKSDPIDEKDFLHDLLEEYLSMLRNEVDYILSDGYTDETIRANEYTFTAKGERFG